MERVLVLVLFLIQFCLRLGEMVVAVSSCIVTLRLLLSEKEVPGLGSRPFYIL